MRIAFFCPHSDPLAQPGEPDAGGQCVYEARIAAALAAAGHEVRCFTRRWGGKAPQAPISEGAHVYRYGMGPEGFLRKEDMGPHLIEFTWQVLESQRGWLEEADVFHGHYWDGGVAALAASLGLGKALLFTSHSLGALKRHQVPDPTPDGSQFRYSLRIVAERRILHGADRIIALSRVERSALAEHYGLEKQQVEVVPGGVDVEAFAPRAAKIELRSRMPGCRDADLLVFTVGRLDPRKGFVELISAIPEVVARVGETGQRVVFLLPRGPEKSSREESWYRQAMVDRAEALGVAEDIHWFPRLSDEELRLYFAGADVFACPSPYEPFGLVLAESFAAGTPVVATPHGGPPDIVSEGVDGYLADPAKPVDFAEKLLKILLADQAQRKVMGEAARRKAHERFAWSSVAGRIADTYRAVLQARERT
jgi:D-inositol-3-phosphate glycosyltransferase